MVSVFLTVVVPILGVCDSGMFRIVLGDILTILPLLDTGPHAAGIKVAFC